MDSQLDEPYNHGKQGELTHESKHGSLTRSQTDSNITYSPEDMVEAPGSSCYITKDGDIDLQVVLKVYLYSSVFISHTIWIYNSRKKKKL